MKGYHWDRYISFLSYGFELVLSFERLCFIIEYLLATLMGRLS